MAEPNLSDRLLSALSEFDAVIGELPTHEAHSALDEATREVFWRDWPSLRSWAESLWQQLNDELAAPAKPVTDPDLDEVGESG